MLYLIFNQGYSAPVSRGDLAEEAIRLGEALVQLMPDEPDVHGVLALMLLHHSRRAAVRRRREARRSWPIRIGRAGTES